MALIEYPDKKINPSKYALERDLMNIFDPSKGHVMTSHSIDSTYVRVLDLGEGYIRDTLIDTAVEPNGEPIKTRRILPQD